MIEFFLVYGCVLGCDSLQVYGFGLSVGLSRGVGFAVKVYWGF